MAREALANRVGAGVSQAADARAAAAEASRRARGRTGARDVDLVYVFASAEFLDDAGDVLDTVHEELAPANLVGCVAQGVVANERELEDGPAVSVWAASLPTAEIETFHAVTLETDDGLAVAGFPDVGAASVVTLVVDPYTIPAQPFLERLSAERPGLPVIGGLAVAGEAGEQALFAGEEVVREGAVGAVVSGVPVVPLVSQGCAPIGREAVITHAEGNVVYELAGQRALDRLREDIAQLTPREQRLAAQGILAGLVIDENRAEYGPGDFLMRGVLGADDESGAIAVGAPVRVGQTLRFHVRDAGTADEELRGALAGGLAGQPAVGALLFTCNGRGTNMFPEPDHDARLISQALGADVAGFFCGGEIGPVGGRPFVHGFTATLAVFLER